MTKLMTKVIIKTQLNDNGQKPFCQIFWMNADGKLTSNYNASYNQVIAVSEVASRASYNHTAEVKLFDGGREVIDTWEEE